MTKVRFSEYLVDRQKGYILVLTSLCVFRLAFFGVGCFIIFLASFLIKRVVSNGANPRSSSGEKLEEIGHVEKGFCKIVGGRIRDRDALCRPCSD